MASDDLGPLEGRVRWQRWLTKAKEAAERAEQLKRGQTIFERLRPQDKAVPAEEHQPGHLEKKWDPELPGAQVAR